MSFLSLTPYLLAAFLVSAALTQVLITHGQGQGRRLRPRPDRWHRRPTPSMGGIAFIGSFLLVLLVAAGSGEYVANAHFWPFVLALSAMFLVGLLDDLFSISPAVKLFCQTAIAVSYILPLHTGIAMSALMALWITAMTNAVNMLDNMDGLAAGSALIVLVGIFAIHDGFAADNSGLLILLCLFSLLAFFLRNISPASIFMGDSGSMPLGFALSCLATPLLAPGGAPFPDAVVMADQQWRYAALAVMSVFIFDQAFVCLTRIARRKPFYKGGRDHLSHRLVYMGWSERQAVLFHYGVAGCGGILANLLARNAPLAGPLFWLFTGLLCIAGGVVWHGTRHWRE